MKSEPSYIPTPEEIAAKCEEIRAEWSLEELARRRVGDPGKYKVPQMKYPTFANREGSGKG